MGMKDRDWTVNLLCSIGLAAIVGGCGWMYPPSALIVGGVGLLGLGIYGGLHE